MATKTWKIGEYAKGGVITVKATEKKVIIIGKEWDYSKGSNRGSDQSMAKEWTRKEINLDAPNAFNHIMEFLWDLTTSYYADEIMKWIKDKTDIEQLSSWYNW